MAKRQRADWNDRLRRAVKADGRSLYRLSKLTGIRIAPLQRFAAGEHNCTLATAEKLAKMLGWRFGPIPKKRKG